MVNLLQLEQTVNPQDYVEGPFGMGPRAKLAEVQKASQLYDVNLDELFSAGITDTNDINKTLARFIAIDRAEKEGITDADTLNQRALKAQQKYTEGVANQQIDPDVFFYKYTNVAPKKGPLSRFTEFALKGATKAAIEITPPLIAAKKASDFVPPPYKPYVAVGTFGGGLLSTIGTGLGEGLVQAGEDLGIFESRPLPFSDRPAAKAGEVFGYDTALSLNAYNLPRSAYNTFSGLLTSRKLMKKKGIFPSLARIPYRTSRFLEQSLVGAGETARGERGKFAQRLFLAGEIPTISGASVGAGLAEYFDPSDDSTATLSELGGGFVGAFTPSNLVLKLLPTIGRNIGSGTTAETRLAIRISDLIKSSSSGETIDQIIFDLENNPEKINNLTRELLNLQMFDEDGVVTEGLPELTPAALSGSPILSAFESRVVNELKKFDEQNLLGPEIINKNREGVFLVARLTELLKNSGNPADAKLAMELEQETLSKIFEQQFIIANQRAINAAEKIRITDPNTLSTNLFEMLKQIGANARRQSKVLYDQVNLTTPVVNVDSITNAIDQANTKFSEIGFAGATNQLNRILRRMGVRVTGPDETSKALQKAQNEFDQLTIKEKNDYEVFQERFFGEGGEDRIRTFVNKPFDELDFGAEGELSVDKKVLELIDIRRSMGKNFANDPLLKRLEKIAKIKIDMANAQKNIDIANQNFFEDLPPQVNANDLLNLRSTIIDEMEIFTSGDRPNRKQVEALGTLLDGVDQALDASVQSESAENLIAYNKAKIFTKAYNDAVVRTFANIVEKKGHNNVAQMKPGLLLKSLTEGGITPTMERVHEIIGAGNVVNQKLKELQIEDNLIVPRAKGLDDPIKTPKGEIIRFDQVSPETVSDAMYEAVQYASRKILDNVEDQDGNVKKVFNAEKAREFLNDDDNRLVFLAFPKLKGMIEDGRSLSLSAEQAQTEAFENLLSEKIKDKDALGQVFANENFTQAITASIENKTSPEKDLTEIITFMNNALERPEVLEKLSNDGLSPENVRNGFKSAIVEYIAIKGEKGDLTDFDAMIKALNEPLLNAPSQDRTNIGEQARDIAQKFPTSQILPSTKNLGQILIENNVFSQAEIDRLNYVLEVGKNVNIAQMTGDSSNISEGMSDNMLAFASWLGAGSIGRFSENVPFLRPQGLVEAGIGARIARRLFSKGPINNQIRMLEKAATDPSFLIQLLKQGKTEKELLKNARSLNAYLYGAGLTAQDNFEEIEEDDKEYMEDRIFENVPIKTRDMDVPLTAPNPFGRDREGLPDNVLQRILGQNADASMSSSPSTLSQPVRPNVSVPISTRSAMAQATSSPEARNRLASAFPGDGILGLLRT